MKPMFKAIASLALILALGLIAYPLYAHCGKCVESAKKIAAQLDQNKMTLARAVTAAEDHSKGRAISVLSQMGDDGEVAVHVFCLSSEKIQKCQVDPKTGRVTEMKEVKEIPISDADHKHDDKATGAGGAGGMGGGGRGGDGAAGGGGGGAGGGSAMMINNRTAEVGCGACVYKMAGAEGCPLAVMLDGKTYIVQGATWPNHDYCDAKQQAVVTGKIEGGKFIATSVKPGA